MIPRREFDNIVSKYNGNRYAKQLSCHDQFLIMCMAQYAGKNSLRDIEASLIALDSAHKLYSCGIQHAAPRNTLAKANEKRSWHIYEELGQVLIKRVRPLYAEDPFKLDIDNMVYAFDSSTISLCLKLCPWAQYKHTTVGVKMHICLTCAEIYLYLSDSQKQRCMTSMLWTTCQLIEALSKNVREMYISIIIFSFSNLMRASE